VIPLAFSSGFILTMFFLYFFSRIIDSNGNTDTASVTVTVVPPPNSPATFPPVARNDFVFTAADTSVTANMLSNDSGNNISVQPIPVAGPSNGSVTINPDGTFTYTVSTPAGFLGSHWA